MRRTLHIVAYDVSDPGRLRAALHSVRNWATGGQKSVHECWLTAGELAALRRQMRPIIGHNEELLIVRLDPRQRPATLGLALPPEDPPWFYAG